ncbi:MAG: hypothetical protein WCR67_01840 [Bacilli bacterium]
MNKKVTQIEIGCLKDIGLNDNEIEAYISNDSISNRKKILTELRKRILSNIHEEYRDLECIDYLIDRLDK